MPTPSVKQAATQIRKWWENAKPAWAWLQAHARVAMIALCALLALVWLAEHDARVKREAELGAVRREAESQVVELRRKAESAIQESRANELLIRDLESRRTALERDAAALRARLDSLREEERARVRRAVTPGHNELAGRADLRPDPARVEPRMLGRDEEIRNRNLETGPAQDLKPQIPGDRHPEGDFPVSSFQLPDSSFQGPSPESRIPDPALDSCREQSKVQDQLIANCEERAELSRAALEAAKRSALQLGEAIKAKDATAARLEEQYRAELKAARGSRLRKFGRALQYVGVGMVIGMAVAL
ncbi:MAG: hypothetical protein HY508_03180 [Acidobacteria bacterium]|nr:hypothetical protein [Acidobacteriota bacterium]